MYQKYYRTITLGKHEKSIVKFSVFLTFVKSIQYKYDVKNTNIFFAII